MFNPKTVFRKTSAALRQSWWRIQLAEMGDNPDIQPTAHFEYASRISMGNQCRVARQAIVRANTEEIGGVCLGDSVSLLENTLISANRGHVTIGDNSWLGPNSVIYGNGGVAIGEDVLIASHCVINTVSHTFNRLDIPMNEQDIKCDPVVIENDVWIGTGATILQGVHIGQGSIIGAGAVVTRSIPPFSIALGVPARVTGSRLTLEDEEAALTEFPNVSSMELH